MQSSLAFDEIPRGTGGAGATEAINQVLHDAGLDAPASLYDEALILAREGRLAPSAERLRMLLVLDPADADAALLLGKVLAGLTRWQESLTWLDAAAANGCVLPPGLRDEVAEAHRREVADAEAERQRLQARERGEVRSLRAEAKRLRTVNAVLDQRVEELDGRVKLWSGATALVAGIASALLIAAIAFGSPDRAPTAEAAPEVSTDAAVADVVAEPTAGTPPTGDAAAPVDVAVATPTDAAPAVAAPTPEPVAPASAIIATHTVKKDENLGAIARKYYGKSSQWQKILDANHDLLRGSHRNLKPGQKLQIPE